jgi:glyceraldehyde 3-phosphate dehydrogenase
MAIRVGINGFGRIGRNVFRILCERKNVDVVGINDITDAKTLAHLLKYDTVMGRFKGEVSAEGQALKVNGKVIPITDKRNPAEIPWSSLGADIVVESTGLFARRADLEKHTAAGAKKVILTVPPDKGEKIDALVVLGVNDDQIKPEHKFVSNASCTTNCLAPLVKIIDEAFGIERGIMTTVHAYTNDQRVADLPHKDLRRARAAAQNIIPTTTGAARAVGEVLPRLNGKLDGLAMRVPVPDGSVVDLVVTLSREVTAEEVNDAMKKGAAKIPTIVRYCDEPIVSSDVIGDPHSCVFDALSTLVLGKKSNMVKLIAWYDNEWGYSARVCDLIEKIAG